MCVCGLFKLSLVESTRSLGGVCLLPTYPPTHLPGWLPLFYSPTLVCNLALQKGSKSGPQ